MERVVLAQGAALCRSVEIQPLIQYMTAAMAARLDGQGFTHALMAAFPYYTQSAPGNLALFARGKDYVGTNSLRLERACHILRSLHPQHRFHPSGNGWPLPAVQAARLAGLGKIGRHGLLIAPPYGSFVTLGAVLTDAPLPPGKDGGFCEDCGCCVQACPTGALRTDEPGRVFARERCLSWMSQHKNLNDAQEEALKQSPTVWGCDLCQFSCPHNANPKPTKLPEYTENLQASIHAPVHDPTKSYGRHPALIERNLKLANPT